MLFSPKANRQDDKSGAEKLNDSVSCSLPPLPQAQGSFWRTTFKVYTALRCKLVLLKELLNLTSVAWPGLPFPLSCADCFVSSGVSSKASKRVSLFRFLSFNETGGSEDFLGPIPSEFFPFLVHHKWNGLGPGEQTKPERLCQIMMANMVFLKPLHLKRTFDNMYEQFMLSHVTHT